MLLPDKFRLTAWKGATFSALFVLHQGSRTDPVQDLTDYTAELIVRDKLHSPTILETFDTSNGGITLGGTEGTIELYMSAEDTANLTWKSGVYDLFLTSTDGTDALLWGAFVVKGVR